eukprot:gb/GECG01015085.1/.p1 GENE.gb/GECG01015085.1/~~gb/GECG01015085.1/.p1  ORF type:complete len:194 (+),score=26.79 gb/GECG01015085.1/:1-582(+)
MVRRGIQQATALQRARSTTTRPADGGTQHQGNTVEFVEEGEPEDFEQCTGVTAGDDSETSDDSDGSSSDEEAQQQTQPSQGGHQPLAIHEAPQQVDGRVHSPTELDFTNSTNGYRLAFHPLYFQSRHLLHGALTHCSKLIQALLGMAWSRSVGEAKRRRDEIVEGLQAFPNSQEIINYLLRNYLDDGLLGACI